MEHKEVEREQCVGRVCRVCGRLWIIANNQRIGLNGTTYTCPHCSNKRRSNKCRKNIL